MKPQYDEPLSNFAFNVNLHRYTKAPVWACIIANFVNNWGYFILLAWMPLYFKQVVGLELAKAAWYSALPWATMAVSGVLAGILADYLISRGVSVEPARNCSKCPSNTFLPSLVHSPSVFLRACDL